MAQTIDAGGFDDEEVRRRAILARINQLGPSNEPRLSEGDPGDFGSPSSRPTVADQAAPRDAHDRMSVLERNEASQMGPFQQTGESRQQAQSFLDEFNATQRRGERNPAADIQRPNAQEQRIERIDRGEEDFRGGTPGQFQRTGVPTPAAFRNRESPAGGFHGALGGLVGNAPQAALEGRFGDIPGELAKTALTTVNLPVGRVAGAIGERLSPLAGAIGERLFGRAAPKIAPRLGPAAAEEAGQGFRLVGQPVQDAYRVVGGGIDEIGETGAQVAARARSAAAGAREAAGEARPYETIVRARTTPTHPMGQLPEAGAELGGAIRNILTRPASGHPMGAAFKPLVGAGAAVGAGLGVAGLAGGRPTSEANTQNVPQQPAGGEQPQIDPGFVQPPTGALPGAVQPPQATPAPGAVTVPVGVPVGPGERPEAGAIPGPAAPQAPGAPPSGTPRPFSPAPGSGPAGPAPGTGPYFGPGGVNKPKPGGSGAAPGAPGQPGPVGGVTPIVEGPGAPGQPGAPGVGAPTPGVGVPGVPGRRGVAPGVTPGQTPTGPTTGPVPQGPLNSEALRTQVVADLNGIAQIINAGSNAPDVMALFLSQGSKLIDLINEQEKALRSQSEAEGKTIDPATQSTLDTLREQLGVQLKATKERLNARGLLDSGILVEAEQLLTKGNLSDQAKILAERLSRIQNNLNASLHQFGQQRISAAQTFGAAGASAQTQAELAERKRLDDLKQTLIRGRLDLGDQYGREEEGALDRDFRAGESAIDRDFKAAQAELDRQAAFARTQADLAARAGDRDAERAFREQEAALNRENARLIAEMNNAARQAGQTSPNPTSTTVELATNNVIAQLEGAPDLATAESAISAGMSDPAFSNVDWRAVQAWLAQKKSAQGGFKWPWER